MTKEIPLTRGMVALVDDEDYERVSAFKWHISSSNNRIYAKNYKLGRLHRFLIQLSDVEHIDHIDGNTLNNQKNNLRVCSIAENNRNKPAQKNNKVGYKGVHIKNGKYTSQINFEKNRIHIGVFTTPEEAARAYDAKARELFGEFARCNFEE